MNSSPYLRFAGICGLTVATLAGLTQDLTRDGAGVTALHPRQAHAYPGPLTGFEESLKFGGGGGRFFTGSLRDGFTCGVCHVSEKHFDLEVTGLDTSIVPNKEYTLTVAWKGEATRVAFNAEIVGPKGFMAGELPDRDHLQVAEVDDKRIVFGVGTDDKRSKSKIEFKWKAPSKSFEGPISFHVAAVRHDDKDKSGDESKDAEDQKTDPESSLLNDELAVFAKTIPLKGASGDSKPSDADKESKGDQE